MSWITVIWSTSIGACLMLALLQLLVWCRDRRSWANLCFSVMALGVIRSPDGRAGHDGGQLPGSVRACDSVDGSRSMALESPAVWDLSISGTGTGRRWLLALALGLRALAVVANFIYRTEPAYQRHPQSAAGHLPRRASVHPRRVRVPNPWLRLGLLASFLQLVYVADASVRLWRSGSRASRQRAVIVGGSLVFFIVFSVADDGCDWNARRPPARALPFLGILLLMGYELSGDALRAAQLGRELAESEQRMALAVEAANLGIWFCGSREAKFGRVRNGASCLASRNPSR